MLSATRRGRLAATAAAIVVAAASLCTASGTPLDVPFLPQGEDLCGGAAAAMVMRYWGARAMYSEAFAPLVDKSAGGINASALAADLRRRGWEVTAGGGDLASLTKEIDRRRPVITLIEVRPGRYHYVVVIGASAGGVVVHDPARGPSRAMSAASFGAAWAKSDRWMLILLPGANGATSAAPTDSASTEARSAIDSRRQRTEDLPDDADRRAGTGRGAGADRPGDPPPAADRRSDSGCQIDGAVRLANGGDYAGARRALVEATAACADNAAPWRELAGVDALEQHWDAAAGHARHAVDLDPTDDQAWRILATAEFLQHHDQAALDAWNRVGEPAIDLVNVTGLRATRYDAVAGAMGVAPGQTLTREALRLAERRARDVPSIALARVTFHPVENGRAQVDVALVERDRAPLAYPAWAAIGLDAAANREVAAAFANPTGGGDLVSVAWRWWPHRPMIAASYAAPAPQALGGGVMRIEASHETQTFSPGPIEETHTRAAFDVSRWLTSNTRVGVAAGIDAWSGRGRTPSISGRVEFWPVPDRLSLEATATRWLDFGVAAAAARWRSRASVSTDGFVWLAGSGYQFATDDAPASLWPGADTGHARDVLLRAHPLLDDGVIVAPAAGNGASVFGRQLAFANAEVQRWQAAGKWPIRIAPAAFVDLARAVDGFGGVSTPTQVDTGAGLRISLLGLGVVRVDVAHGLRDGRNAVSIAFVHGS